MEIEIVTIDWIITQLAKYKISKKQLAEDLGLNYEDLISLLSNNDINKLDSDSQKSSFFYYFNFLELRQFDYSLVKELELTIEYLTLHTLHSDNSDNEAAERIKNLSAIYFNKINELSKINSMKIERFKKFL